MFRIFFFSFSAIQIRLLILVSNDGNLFRREQTAHDQKTELKKIEIDFSCDRTPYKNPRC